MDEQIQSFFEHYQQLFMDALHDKADMADVTASYASAFIAASPAGVNAGQNDDALRQLMAQGFAYYRQIGTKDMQLRRVDVVPIDDVHCLARVGWTAVYDRGAQPDVAIDFDVHYLMQLLDATPKVFGWISGDEQATLREHGITP
jgi:hypothetical protein